jgi:hypothetical protein
VNEKQHLFREGRLAFTEQGGWLPRKPSQCTFRWCDRRVVAWGLRNDNRKTLMKMKAVIELEFEADDGFPSQVLDVGLER